MLTIYFVRHCAAEGNVNGTFQGRTDADIVPLGRQQLELLSLRLRNVPFSAIYTSPLMRARKTAEAINQYHKLPIIADPGLIEIDMGRMDGLKWTELPEKFPEAAQKWSGCTAEFEAPGGESMAQVYDRMRDCVAGIAARENCQKEEKTICITTHGAALRCFLCWAHGWPVGGIDDTALSDNTAISEVRFSDDGSCEVLREGDASHLAEGMSVTGRMGWGRKK